MVVRLQTEVKNSSDVPPVSTSSGFACPAQVPRQVRATSFLSHGGPHPGVELQNEASGAGLFTWLKLEHLPGCLWEISQPAEKRQSALSTLLQEEKTSTCVLLIRGVSR